MRRITCFFVIYLLAFSQDADDIRYIQKLTSQIYISEFFTLDSILRAYRNTKPDAIEPAIYTLFIEQLKLADEEITDAERIDRFMTQCEHFIDQLEAIDDRSAWQHYLLGNLQFVLAAEQNRQGYTFGPMGLGGRAVDNLQTAVAMDSTLADGLLPVAVYKYWKSVYTRNIPFIADERQDALRQLKQARRGQFHADAVTLHQTVYIQADRGELNSAFVALDSMLSAHPGARTLRWARAKLRMKDRRYEQAIDDLNILLSHYKQKSSIYNILDIKRRLAVCHDRLGRRASARDLLTAALQLPVPDVDRVRDKRDQLVDLADELRNE